jgi:hypothetical protein
MRKMQLEQLSWRRALSVESLICLAGIVSVVERGKNFEQLLCKDG